MESLRQSLTFLYRCKTNGVFPNFILHSVRPPPNMKPTKFLTNFLTRTRRTLLTLAIRTQHQALIQARKSLTELKAKTPSSLLSQLEPAITASANETKQRNKSTLQRKFDQLQARTSQQPSDLNHATTKNQNNNTSTKNANDDPHDRVTVLNDIHISASALNALSKGPKFTLSPRLSRNELQHTVQIETAALAYAIRWHHVHNTPNNATQPAKNVSSTYSINRLCPLCNKRTEPLRLNKDAKRAIQGLQTDLQRLVERFDPRTIRPNISRPEQKAIIELRNQENITITRSDKGGEMVVMKTNELQQLCLDHLNDSTTYERLKKNPTNTIRLKINKTINDILTQRNFPPNLIYNLQTPSSARTQRFYALPKTHKNILKIHPIVSACGGIFDRLGWLLQLIFKPLLKNISAHLDNTATLLQRYHNIDKQQLKGQIPISFDVVSLYTNIDNDEAIDTALQYTNKYELNTYGLKTDDLFILLHLLLDNNIFSYEDIGIYRQIRGLAMGSRISGILAILAMDRFERLFIYRNLEPQLTIYVRYVDDIGTVVPNSDEAYRTLTYLNSKHPTIKFELELPDSDGYLPILDIQMKIDDNGQIHHRLYRKKASKNITLHFNSHHPRTVKKAIITNELRRATLCSSLAHRPEAISMTRTKLRRNGYPDLLTDNACKNKQKKPKKKPNADNTLFTLKIPFISDTFNYNVRQILNKHNIPARLTNTPGLTLRKLSTKKQQRTNATCNKRTCPAPTICQRTNIVYEATCNICQQTYIGQTTRRLHERAREHMTAATNGQRSSALGEHYADTHPNATPDLSFKILKQNNDVLRLHIEEALCIQTLSPPLNRRQEHLGTGFLP